MDQLQRNEGHLSQILRDKYGELVNLDQLAEVYQFPSPSAVKKAYSRGNLAVNLYKIPGRPGLFAKVEEVAQSIDALKPHPR